MKYEETPQYGTGYYGNQPYQQPYQQPPQQYQQGSTCRSCGAAYEPGAQYCPKCGNRI
ncbi:MAG: zinc-ribbon domain-containing protein [Methanomassiliicoccales archaeon]|nr:zinc-ribbon domain-containing protein [Methanomassiliicoccales archaeon]